MSEQLLALSDRVVDLRSGRIREAEGCHAQLTGKELALLLALAQEPAVPLDRDRIEAAVWGAAGLPAGSRAVDTVVRRLRIKLERDPAASAHIVTQYGGGYALVPPTRPVVFDPALPVDHEPFIGRTAELQTLTEAVRSAPLCTIAGAPGIGKTRIAVELARQLHSTLLGGAWFVDLGETQDTESVIAALRIAVGTESPQAGRIASSRSPGKALQQLIGRLRLLGPSVVVLDTCERALDAVGSVAQTILQSAPEVRVIATSRRPLGVAGERLVRIEPLRTDDAMTLFESLSRRVRPDFTLTAANERVVAELVGRLDHLPLAVALAASRMGALSLTAICDRLDQRFRLLRGRHRHGVTRQRTLEAATSWSWDLLTEELQHALMAVSVCRGGLTSAFAAALLPGGESETWLAALVERSLLTQDSDGRFGIYDFVREFAEGMLAERVELRDQLHRAHRRAMLAWLADNPHAGTAELPNLQAATDRAQHARDDAEARPLGLALRDALWDRGSTTQLLEVVHQLLDLNALTIDERVETCAIGSNALRNRGEFGAAHALLDHATHVAEASGELGLMAKSLRSRGTLRRQQGDLPGAERDLTRALDAARTLGRWEVVGHAQLSLAVLFKVRGDIDAAQACYEDILGLPEPQVLDTQAYARAGLGQLERRRGHFEQALRHFDAALQAHTTLGGQRAVLQIRQERASTLLDIGRLDAAERDYVAVVGIAARMDEFMQQATVKGNLGLLYRTRGDWPAARAAFEGALGMLSALDDRVEHATCAGNLAELDRLTGNLGRAEIGLDGAIAALRGLEQWNAVAELEVSRARVDIAKGQWDAARMRLDEAEMLARSFDNPLVVAFVLAARGLVEVHEGLPAAETLAEAEALVSHVHRDAEIRQALDVLRRSLDA